jgi:hypothetical protein
MSAKVDSPFASKRKFRVATIREAAIAYERAVHGRKTVYNQRGCRTNLPLALSRLAEQALFQVSPKSVLLDKLERPALQGATRRRS